MHARDCSCAPILHFFSAVSGGATAERQIQNRILVIFTTGTLGRLASPIMHRFGRCFRHLLENHVDELSNAPNTSQFRR